jgi:hypothetical protein
MGNNTWVVFWTRVGGSVSLYGPYTTWQGAMDAKAFLGGSSTGSGLVEKIQPPPHDELGNLKESNEDNQESLVS